MIDTHYVRTLSDQESRLGVTLLQRAGKLSEEQGELWQEVLALTNSINKSASADGDPAAVAEETVDVMINCLDILAALGVTDSEIQSIMTRKCVKWSNKMNAHVNTLFMAGGKL